MTHFQHTYWFKASVFLPTTIKRTRDDTSSSFLATNELHPARSIRSDIFSSYSSREPSFSCKPKKYSFNVNKQICWYEQMPQLQYNMYHKYKDYIMATPLTLSNLLLRSASAT